MRFNLLKPRVRPPFARRRINVKNISPIVIVLVLAMVVIVATTIGLGGVLVYMFVRWVGFPEYFAVGFVALAAEIFGYHARNSQDIRSI